MARPTSRHAFSGRRNHSLADRDTPLHWHPRHDLLPASCRRIRGHDLPEQASAAQREHQDPVEGAEAEGRSGAGRARATPGRAGRHAAPELSPGRGCLCGRVIPVRDRGLVDWLLASDDPKRQGGRYRGLSERSADVTIKSLGEQLRTLAHADEGQNCSAARSHELAKRHRAARRLLFSLLTRWRSDGQRGLSLRVG